MEDTALIDLSERGQHRQLKKILGVTFGIAVTVGGMIGLGILRTPGTVATQLPGTWLILAIWLAGGLYSLLGVFSAAELGVSVPRAGGWYVFTRRAFGELPGFTTGWLDLFAYPAGFAITALTIGEYIGKLFPQLAEYPKATGLTCIIGVAFVNWVGLAWGSRFQEILSFLKSAVLVVITIAAFTIGSSQPMVADTGSHGLVTVAAIVIALQAVIFTYDGWYAAIYFSEECRDHSKLPRSMIWAVVLVTVIYLLINAALLYALPIASIASSTLPVADLANSVFGIYGDRIVTLLAIITLLSLMNANLLTGPRIIFALSRDGLFIDKLAEVNSGGTPGLALLLLVGVSIPLILTGSFDAILAVSAFLFIAMYMLGFLALIVLRKKEPDLARPYKAFGYPWSTLIVLLGSAAFLVAAVSTDTVNALYALGLIFMTIPFYYLIKLVNRRSAGSS